MDLYNLDLPIIDVGLRIGNTDYIDFLTWDEITQPVMKGKDCFGREFVVIKVIIDKIKIMETYFKRFSDGTKWMSCGHATPSFLNTCGSGLTQSQIDLLQKIIDGESVLLTSNHNLCSEHYINKYVRLYNKKKEDSATKIQKQWLKCRWNPRYKICQKIQYDNFITNYNF